MHLEGALTPSLLFTLAANNHISLPEDDPAFTSRETLLARYKRFTSLDEFLHYYYIGMSVLIHAADFEAVAWDYFQHAAADGVHHAELFFDPQAHMSRGVGYQTVLSGFTAARQRAEKEFGITSELISCFLRHLPVADSLAAFRQEDVQKSYRSGAVIGVGLDSSEAGNLPRKWNELYREAERQGLRRTAHAGEEGPASYIADAVDSLQVERVDHGVRLAEDPELMRWVADKGLMLTVCPISNVTLGCVMAISEVPIRKFLDAGVRFSINSDDPAYFGGYILDNYCAVQEAFGLSVGEWRAICTAGIEGSWCSRGRKDEVLRALDNVVGEWN